MPDAFPQLDLDDVYDESTLAALDQWRPGTGAEPRRVTGLAGRGAFAAAMASSIVLGLRDAFETDGTREAFVELDPGLSSGDARPVTFVFVPGAPRVSRIIVRPWLMAS